MLKICQSILFYLVIIWLLPISSSLSQSDDYIGIIPPFHNREALSNNETQVELNRQLFILFAYKNAVAVYSESDFINNSDNFVDQEFSLPSTGYDVNGDDPGGRLSNGIWNVQLWIQGERNNPQFIRDGSEEWYTVRAKFDPHENLKIKALFWAETSLTDIDSLPGFDTTIIVNGKRGFLIDLGHAAIWNNVIESITTFVVLHDGVNSGNNNFSAVPETYQEEDSTLTWDMEYIEPSESDNIIVNYESEEKNDSTSNTMAELSSFIVKYVYDQLLDYADQLNN
ncbi:MAG: hypothetical protein ABI550_02855 [Ignavibacteriaceae bacterium]